MLCTMKIYLVGGAVRDTLLNQKVSEKDWVVVGATPEEMLKRGFKKVGKYFPVFIHPKTGEEYALARTERKTSHGYHGFTFNTSPHITIEDDLKRRDLTINAIAQDADGTLIDPWGGQQDIKARLLRHVSHTFVEDPVRVLRVARFAARFESLGFTIAPETLNLIQEMVANGEVDYLVAERVWQETAKAFATGRPSIYLKTLLDVGALARIAPELDNFFHHLADSADKDNISMSTFLFDAIDQAPKHMPDILLAILSFYAHRIGVSINTLSERWKLPSRCQKIIRLAEKSDTSLKSAADLSNEELLDFLTQTDALRDREQLQNLLTAYELSNFENICLAAPINRITCALDTVAAVKFDSSLQDLPGAQAKAQVRKKYLEALNSL